MQNEVDYFTPPELQHAIERGASDEAVDILENVQTRRALSTRELVLKARCLQLGSGSVGDELVRAEAALRAALAIDGEYVPALVELGWFIYAVADDALGGKELFERAFEISSRECNEALSGLFQAVKETQSESAAHTLVASHVQSAINAFAQTKSRKRPIK